MDEYATIDTATEKRCSLCGPCLDIISRTVSECSADVRGIGQGKARHRKYKRRKLGGGLAYDRSSD
jgi:hypothetical protein